MNTRETAGYGMTLAYNAAIIGGCAYLVFWRGHSGWWFLLAMLLMASFKTGKDEE